MGKALFNINSEGLKFSCQMWLLDDIEIKVRIGCIFHMEQSRNLIDNISRTAYWHVVVVLAIGHQLEIRD